MNSNLERRIERLEQAVATGSDDPRAYCYPNGFAELARMASMSEEERQKHLRTRRTKPTPEICDQFDEIFRQRKSKKNNQTAESRAAK